MAAETDTFGACVFLIWFTVFGCIWCIPLLRNCDFKSATYSHDFGPEFGDISAPEAVTFKLCTHKNKEETAITTSNYCSENVRTWKRCSVHFLHRIACYKYGDVTKVASATDINRPSNDGLKLRPNVQTLPISLDALTFGVDYLERIRKSTVHNKCFKCFKLEWKH
jgi:hypothetical protein